jgi:uncharacterized coiled-coil protein SlyX
MSNILPGAKLMQVKEWGFPQGATRPVPPSGMAFSVIHITGNSRLPSAENEASWRINDPANQNSMTFCVNRDGSVVQLLADPLHMDPWSNGDVNRPDTSNRRIAAVVADGVNANERTLVSIENVGYEPGYPLTDAQIKACGRIIAHYHKAAGVAINRNTVIGHYQLNSVTRPNCPGVNKAVVDKIVAAAQAAAGTLPDTSTGEDPAVIEELQAQIAELRDEKQRMWARIKKMEARITDLIAQVAATADDAQQLEEANLTIGEKQAVIRRLRDRVIAIKDKVAALATDVSDD